jgi:curli biogenesis system outer membrane secretion channel CsgG
MSTKGTGTAFKRRTSYEVNTDRNYIDAPYYGLRKRIAVADFDNKLEGIPESLNIGQRASEMLITELVKTGRFVVVERRILQDIVGDHQLGQTGLVRKETAAKVGSLLGAQILVDGVVSEFDEKKFGGEGALVVYKGVGLGLKSHSTHVAVDTRLIDTSTGQVLQSHNAVGKATAEGLILGITQDDITFDVEGFQNTPLGQAIRRAVFNAVWFIVNKMDDVPFQANVIKTQGTSVYINAGSLMNVQVGDRLFGYRGKALGAEASDVGTIEVIEVEDKFSIGKLTSGKGKLQRGDILRFRQHKGVYK